MSEIVLVALVLMAIVLVTTLASAALIRSRLRRANAVRAGVDTGAPMHWLVWPFPTAMLHRRLRDAVAVARAACPAPPPAKRLRRRAVEPAPLETIVVQLEQHAVSLDQDLVLATRLRGRNRHHVLAATARQVAVVERLATRISRVARTPSPLSGGTRLEALDRLQDEVLALEAARDEINRIELQLLGRPLDPVPARR